MTQRQVKNYLWLLIILIGAVVLLSGCSSAPKLAGSDSQYCYNNKTITVKNGKDVSSESVTTCSDDRIGKLVDVRAGLAKGCNYVVLNIRKGHDYVPRKIIACKDLDGDTSILFSTVVN